MKQTSIVRLFAALLITVVVVLVSPKATQFDGFGLGDIQTDNSTVYPHTAATNRAWFVEMVLPAG